MSSMTPAKRLEMTFLEDCKDLTFVVDDETCLQVVDVKNVLQCGLEFSRDPQAPWSDEYEVVQSPAVHLVSCSA
jgi:hypothetical protein